jgi:hypothetical protein
MGSSHRLESSGPTEIPHVLLLLIYPALSGVQRKRLDLARDAQRAPDGVPGRIASGWVER